MTEQPPRRPSKRLLVAVALVTAAILGVFVVSMAVVARSIEEPMAADPAPRGADLLQSRISDAVQTSRPWSDGQKRSLQFAQVAFSVERDSSGGVVEARADSSSAPDDNRRPAAAKAASVLFQTMTSAHRTSLDEIEITGAAASGRDREPVVVDGVEFWVDGHVIIARPAASPPVP